MPVQPIRVASIPGNHPYVRHLAAVDGPDGVTRLADPVPQVPEPLPGQWWPPVMLEPDWVRSHRDEFDILHLNFGFDAAEPDAVRAWCEELARAGRPMVMTVHDLANPHFVDQRRHRQLLDLLIPRADGLITLTPGAAAAIEQGWGRRATVIPHPHIVALDWAGPTTDPAAQPGRFVIGVSAKSLRANVDPLPVLTALDRAVAGNPDVTVRVDLHPDVWTRADHRAVAVRDWLIGRRGDAGWQIRTHPMFTDEELWQYLRELDLCVLPYAFGTHSGWLEACVDVGTGVLVPDIGFYAEQHGHPTFHRAADGTVDPAGFAAVLRRVLADPALARPPAPDRRQQRAQIAAAHRLLYREVIDGWAAAHPD